MTVHADRETRMMTYALPISVIPVSDGTVYLLLLNVLTLRGTVYVAYFRMWYERQTCSQMWPPCAASASCCCSAAAVHQEVDQA